MGRREKLSKAMDGRAAATGDTDAAAQTKLARPVRTLFALGTIPTGDTGGIG